ncbi:DUF4272 domain-containing protein [Ruegeria sp. Ofav3-42]|uniref:DUF4272 domain-containing protein n=1 Tax=Ruegeria sp. Ofav3-42 TaxID=2917759 RepID=UPI001EF752BF|nr:DUF4272 domain-containing protein [Ruegeria sp. Ofav3-42]
MVSFSNIRKETARVLGTRHVSVNPHLPFLDIQGLKKPVEICERINALHALVGLTGVEGLRLKKWLLEANTWRHLSLGEQALFEKSELDTETMNRLSWMQESVYVLCWAGNLVPDINGPESESDMSDIYPQIPPASDFQDLLVSFRLRSEAEICQKLDIYYCLHASTRHPELWQEPVDLENVKIAAVLERRHALEWLCGGSDEWDEVSLDT